MAKIKSTLKDTWLPITPRDEGYWIGQWLLSSMVMEAWAKGGSIPTRIGKIGDMKTLKDGSGKIPFEAEWEEVAGAATTTKLRRKRGE